MSLFLELGKVRAVPPCNGFVGRYIDNCYAGSGALITHRRQVKLLKRKTCNGCEYCGGTDWVYDALREDPDSVEFAPDLVNDDLVTAVPQYSGTDWETGEPTRFWVKFVKWSPP